MSEEKNTVIVQRGKGIFFPKGRCEGFGSKGILRFYGVFPPKFISKNCFKKPNQVLKLGFPKFSNDNSKLIFEMTNKGLVGRVFVWLQGSNKFRVHNAWISIVSEVFLRR